MHNLDIPSENIIDFPQSEWFSLCFWQVLLNHPTSKPRFGVAASVDNPLDFSGVAVRLPMLV